MAKRFDLLVPINQVYRRSIKVAASLIGAGTEGDLDLSLAPDTVDIVEGDWVTLDASQLAIKADETAAFAWPVWTDGGRYDVRALGAVTVVTGQHWAQTANFTVAGLTTVGQALTLDAGADAGKLLLATTGDVVFAHLERIPHSTSTAFPNGYIDYNTYGAGYISA